MSYDERIWKEALERGEKLYGAYEDEELTSCVANTFAKDFDKAKGQLDKKMGRGNWREEYWNFTAVQETPDGEKKIIERR